ncbi:hypothetical protein EVJ58_g5974, partial [Rhodofomes roseus]
PTPAPAGPIAAAASKASGRPKSTRKASDNKNTRKPGPTTDTSATLTPNPPPAAAARPSRRRRSQNKVLPALNTKSSLSSDSSAFTVQSAPERGVITSKDIPPHLMTPSDAHTFDIKSDIDALVDRMRSVAMERPHTPGSHSHFDWASDDDDSLPDLPDWGKTDVKTDGKPSIISPILEDALRPLPNIEVGSPFTVPLAAPESAAASPAKAPHEVISKGKESQAAPQVVGVKEKKEEPLSALINLEQSRVGRHEESKAGEPKDSRQPTQAQPSQESTTSRLVPTSNPSPSKAPAKLPIHPSLPPKPTTTVEPASAKRHPRHAEPGHKRGNSSTGSAEQKTENGLANSIHAPKSSLLESIHAPKSNLAESTHLPNGGLAESTHAPKKGLADSIHAPKSAATSGENEPSPKDHAPEKGLAASIHAPQTTQSAPSHISSHPIPDVLPHLRSRGPARGHRQPYSASISSFQHPDLDRGARTDNAHHTRTQSSPPTGAGAGHAHSRSAHATRPVITGDAISRLARTLGAHAPRRETAVPVPAAAKD